MCCSACGTENPTAARFCEECGAALGRACPACGHAAGAKAKFCAECGQPLREAAATASLVPRSYTPKHLSGQLTASRAALEGERKQVTVLFCDIANSTGLAERLGAEAFHLLLNRFFELALGVVHRYEGTVNQFLGDGFMALFGAPITHEDHARRAVLAALEIERSLGEHLAEPEATGRRQSGAEAHSVEVEPIRVRMGLNTGQVVVGAIGDNLRRDYTAMGDATNTAPDSSTWPSPGRSSSARSPLGWWPVTCGSRHSARSKCAASESRSPPTSWWGSGRAARRWRAWRRAG
jgi:class 3 adenylate cyclase